MGALSRSQLSLSLNDGRWLQRAWFQLYIQRCVLYKTTTPSFFFFKTNCSSARKFPAAANSSGSFRRTGSYAPLIGQKIKSARGRFTDPCPPSNNIFNLCRYVFDAVCGWAEAFDDPCTAVSVLHLGGERQQVKARRIKTWLPATFKEQVQ